MGARPKTAASVGGAYTEKRRRSSSEGIFSASSGLLLYALKAFSGHVDICGHRPGPVQNLVLLQTQRLGTHEQPVHTLRRVDDMRMLRL